MPDFIDYQDKQAAVALADTLNYEQAASRLGVTAFELKLRLKRWGPNFAFSSLGSSKAGRL